MDTTIKIDIRVPVDSLGALQITDPQGTIAYMVATKPLAGNIHSRTIKLPELKPGLYRIYFNFEVEPQQIQP